MAEGDIRRGEALPVQGLRVKYARLAAKYQELVDRVDRRALQDLSVYKRDTWRLQASSAAFAAVEGGGIALANERFASMARALTGPLVRIDPPGGDSYPDLRALALAEARSVARARSSVRELRYRDAGSAAVISIRLERDGRGRRRAVLFTAEDVSEHAHRVNELERTREVLLHRERLRVLGELAVSIAHDLGNTLRGTSFQLAALEDPALAPEKRAQALRGIAARIDIASAVISRLHDFAGAGSLTTVQLQRIVPAAVVLVETELREGAPVEVRVSVPDLPHVRGSVPELSLLFVNLLRNARQAMAEGGVISIVARRRGDSVTVTVRDQGPGIPRQVQARLFEPFFTTKGAQGTGLGLWLAAGTMARLGGSIRAVNRPRRGTVFTLSFPVAEVTGRRARARGRAAGPHRRPSRAPRRRTDPLRPRRT